MDVQLQLLHLNNKSAFPKNETNCLIKGSDKLTNERDLRVPVSSKISFTTTFDEEPYNEILWQNGATFTGMMAPILNAKVYSNETVTKDPALYVRKSKREIQIEVDENDANVQKILEICDAGDSFYFIFPNTSTEVDFILKRLGVSERANSRMNIIKVCDKTVFPDYIPNPTSISYVLTYCLDIRRSPGRPVIRSLADYTENPKERRRILELSSIQGNSEFTIFIRQANISLMDFLIAFPSCKPTIGALIELIPRLLPRPYTIACYKSVWKNRLRFIYSLMRFEPNENGLHYSRYGNCSGWLRTLKPNDSLRIILKEPSKFRLPPILNPKMEITEIPLIMVGPGTGITPFIAFLEKIDYQLSYKNSKNSFIPRILLYGSSDLSEEFLFEKELKNFLQKGILTKLILCESRALAKENIDIRPKYVQDALKANGKEIIDLILHDNNPGLFFACGDVKNISKELWTCLKDILMDTLGYSLNEAMECLKKLRLKEQLIEDVWS